MYLDLNHWAMKNYGYQRLQDESHFQPLAIYLQRLIKLKFQAELPMYMREMLTPPLKRQIL